VWFGDEARSAFALVRRRFGEIEVDRLDPQQSAPLRFIPQAVLERGCCLFQLKSREQGLFVVHARNATGCRERSKPGVLALVP
jgi:hypothetical protein